MQDCLRALQGLWEEKPGQVSVKLCIRQLEKGRIKPSEKGDELSVLPSLLSGRVPRSARPELLSAKNSKLAEEPVLRTKVVLTRCRIASSSQDEALALYSFSRKAPRSVLILSIWPNSLLDTNDV